MKRYTKRYARRGRKQSYEDALTGFITSTVQVTYLFVREGIRAIIVLRRRQYHCDNCQKRTFFAKQKAHTIVLTGNGTYVNRMGWYCPPCSKKVKRKTEIA